MNKLRYRYPDALDRIPAHACRVTATSGQPNIHQAIEELAIVAAAAAAGFPHSPVRALDVGAGTGRLLSVIASCATAVTVLDPDEERLGLATEAVAPEERSRCTFVVDDLETFQSAYSKFELVVCSHVLQHIATKQRLRFLEGLRNVTGKAGILMMTFPSSGTCSERYLISKSMPDGRIETRQVEPAEFDIAVANSYFDLNRIPSALWLPVWHPTLHAIFASLEAFDFSVLTARPYRKFEFEFIATSERGKKHRATAFDFVLTARRNSGAWT